MRNEGAYSILEQLVRSVRNDIESKKEDSTNIDWGLYSGLLGEIIFLCYHSLFSNNKQEIDYANETIEYFLYNVPISKLDYSLCSGLSGVLLGLDHLNRIHFSQIDYDNVIPVFCSSIVSAIENLAPTKNCNHDLMYGLSGIGLVSAKLHLTGVVCAICDDIISSLQHSPNGDYILFEDYQTKNYMENICLSHGMGGVIMLLAMAHKENMYSCKDHINACVQYLLSNKYSEY